MSVTPLPPDRALAERPSPSSAWRTVAVLASTLLCLTVAATSFWYQDWRYSLPTPRPPGLVQAAPGTAVEGELPLPRTDGRPLLLHFTNPDCPCSRFARDQVRELVREFGEEVRFLAVVEVESGAGPPPDATGLGLEQLADPGGRLAARLGVYSTPQAVILAPDGTLWYRGNYNRARFCTQAESAYARLALAALVSGAARPLFSEAATRAYGCALPEPSGADS